MVGEKVMPLKTFRMGDLSASVFRKPAKSTGRLYTTYSIQTRIPGTNGNKPTYKGFNILASQLDALKFIIAELEQYKPV